jgi:uncharacterized protein YidB (DUF937 family)
MGDKVQRRERGKKVQYQLVTTYHVYAFIFLRKTRILASLKDKGQMTRDGGTENRNQRSKGQEQWDKAKKKGTLGQLKDRVQRSGDKEKSRERGDRGRET